MSGPFKPDDFNCSMGDFAFASVRDKAAEIANAIDAKRWECEKVGEHEALKNGYTGDPARRDTGLFECWKCGKNLVARWEVKEMG